MKIIFRQFRAEGCNSFIIGDAASGKACIVDPRADFQDAYEQYLALRGLRAALVVDTHTHADHYSGSHLVAEAFGAPIAMSERTESARADLRLADGQLVEVGGLLALEALATPGHTPDSVTFVWRGPGASCAFTGDTLFIGGSGRVDFKGASAAAQYESIYTKLAALPDDTWMLPGHDYSNLLFSTIGHEKRHNPHWRFAGPDEFVKAKEAELLEAQSAIPTVLSFNLTARPRTTPRGGAVTVCATACFKPQQAAPRIEAARFRDLLGGHRGDGTRFIDVREPDEFTAQRIDGLENIPLSELFLHWRELSAAPAVYLACQTGNRSLAALETLRRLGLVAEGDLAGGLAAWIAGGFPVTRA